MRPSTSPALSVVVPLLNEADSLRPLCERLTISLAEVGELYEVIFVDDGSTDASPTVLEDLYRNDREHVRVIQFRRNFGKTAGLNAGFAHARGRVVVTMDADLQDDPAEIPAMLAKLDEGYDLVAAWRVDRRDPLEKTLPSRFFNFIVSRFTGVDLHDFNCGFKVYRRAVTDSVRLYGELHRFIPVLAHQQGFRIAEVPVQHHPRQAGASKYGAKRYVKGFLDFGAVLFLTTYLKRPLHLFGAGGLAVFGVGVIINLYLAFLWVLRELGGRTDIAPIGTRPLLMVGVLAMILGIQLISIGLLGEMLRYFTFRPTEEYAICRILEKADDFDDRAK
jgi:glycosyltransferase involved in cell wall biosynthesis